MLAQFISADVGNGLIPTRMTKGDLCAFVCAMETVLSACRKGALAPRAQALPGCAAIGTHASGAREVKALEFQPLGLIDADG